MFFNLKSSFELFIFNVVVYAIMQLLRLVVDQHLPKSHTDLDRKIFQSYTWEDKGNFYDKYFKVSKWKDYLPSINFTAGFSKRHIVENSSAYFEQFIREMNMSESNHIRSILSTLVFAIWNPLNMFLLVMALSVLIQAPFIIIQRYNRPRMVAILESVKIREAKDDGEGGFGQSASVIG